MTVVQLKNRVAELESRVGDLEAELDHAQAVAGIKRGLSEADKKQGIPARTWAAKVRMRHRLSR